MTITFLSVTEMWELLSSNHSYYRRFCPADYQARGVRNLREYLLRIAEAVDEFSDAQQRKLKRAIAKAKNHLSRIRVDWFDGEKASGMAWCVGCIGGDGWAYENGMPHTVGNVIVLSHDQVDACTLPQLARLLVHEKTHIYQRLHPGKVRKYLLQRGFQRVRRQSPRDGIRANPDTDGVIYARRGEVYAFHYRGQVRDLHSVRASNASDASNASNASKEHPYEEMAYTIERWKW